MTADAGDAVSAVAGYLYAPAVHRAGPIAAVEGSEGALLLVGVGPIHQLCGFVDEGNFEGHNVTVSLVACEHPDP
jgi:hypothetical protein